MTSYAEVVLAPPDWARSSWDLDVDIDVNRGGGDWYLSPVWMAIGGIALVLVVLLVAMAARGGGGTTVVKE